MPASSSRTHRSYPTSIKHVERASRQSDAIDVEVVPFFGRLIQEDPVVAHGQRPKGLARLHLIAPRPLNLGTKESKSGTSLLPPPQIALSSSPVKTPQAPQMACVPLPPITPDGPIRLLMMIDRESISLFPTEYDDDDRKGRDIPVTAGYLGDVEM